MSMSDDAKVPLPKPGGAIISGFHCIDAWTADQLRAYGDARERAARSAEREAICAQIQERADRIGRAYDQHKVQLHGILRAELLGHIDAIRARAEESER